MAGLGTRRALLVCALGVLAAPLLADDIDSRARALAHVLMSPYCPGLLLADCKSDGARVLRLEIGERLRAGETDDAVVSDLAARFGPEIRAVPGFEGIGAVLWTAPAVIGAVSLAVAVQAINLATHRRAGAAEDDILDPSALTPADDERVAEELDAID